MKLNIELTIEEVNQVLAALEVLPYRQVATLFEKIKSQAMEQLTPKPETTEPQ